MSTGEVALTPADVDRLFAERLNAGDAEGVAALYEPAALLVVRGGDDAVGTDAIRETFRARVDAELFLECDVIQVRTAGDTAVLYNNWHGTRRGPCGDRLGIEGKALEIVRRQPDGSWLFVIDDPYARG